MSAHDSDELPDPSDLSMGFGDDGDEFLIPSRFLSLLAIVMSLLCWGQALLSWFWEFLRCVVPGGFHG